MRHVQDSGMPMEAMEPRLMLAVAPVVGAVLSSTGVLAVRGERAAANQITVKLSADGTQIETAVGANQQSFAAADVKRVTITGGNDVDTVAVDLTGATFNRATVITGRGGNDVITAGGEDDIIWGGAGDDVIDAGAGNDRILGEAGDDDLSGGDGNDRVDGGIGDDLIDGGLGDDVLMAGPGADDLSGGDGNDTLVGNTDEGDVLDGGAGENVVRDLADLPVRRGGQRPGPARGFGGGMGGMMGGPRR